MTRLPGPSRPSWLAAVLLAVPAASLRAYERPEQGSLERRLFWDAGSRHWWPWDWQGRSQPASTPAAPLRGQEQKARDPAKKAELLRLHPPVPSIGCSNEAAPHDGKSQENGFHLHVHVPWDEPGLPPVNRSYGMYVPSSYNHSKPTPLVLVFHGWGEDGAKYHRNYDFGRLASREDFVVIYPIGMDDCNTTDCLHYASWNGVGTSSSSDAKMSCDLSVQTGDYCYDSCKIKKGRCHPCDWTTCYDDVGFIRKLLGHVQEKLCVDRTRIFGHGCSNGAMFLHELAQKLPGVFAGAVASCGGKPHLGWEDGLPAGGPPVAMATVVGRMDDTIPQNGSLKGCSKWDGYIFTPEQKVMDVYKRYNHCTNLERRRYGAGYNAKNMTCWEEGYDCAGNVSVAHCIFSGFHDFNLGTGNDDVADDLEFAWEFLTDHPLAPEYLAS